MSGKIYNNEKAIISLTSWKKRIKTVGLTLFSLLKQCPSFHLVLVLSEEEFPHKEAELPSDILSLLNAHQLEVLWVYANTKSFKKVIPTMRIYKDVPIISADDDCIYICNYAQELFDAYMEDNTRPINYRKSSYAYCTCGPATLYPPCLFNYIIAKYDNMAVHNCLDDGFMQKLLSEIKCQPRHISTKFPCFFHDEIAPITGSQNVAKWRADIRYK